MKKDHQLNELNERIEWMEDIFTFKLIEAKYIHSISLTECVCVCYCVHCIVKKEWK